MKSKTPTKKKKTSEMDWLRDHADQLEKFSGKWVAFNIKKGIFYKGASIRTALKVSRKKGGDPFVFHVPTQNELSVPPARKPKG